MHKPLLCKMGTANLSSNVRSSHWLLNVSEKFAGRLLSFRPRLQIRSLRWGFILKAIADDPIWVVS